MAAWHDSIGVELEGRVSPPAPSGAVPCTCRLALGSSFKNIGLLTAVHSRTHCSPGTPVHSVNVGLGPIIVLHFVDISARQNAFGDN